MIKIKNIQKKFKNFSLKSVNCVFEKGNFISFLGQSGSGKSTLLNIIAGLDEDYLGEIEMFGRSPIEAIKNGDISMVFQEDLLLPHLTITENIAFPLKIKKIPKKEIKIKVNEIMKEMQIIGKEDCFPNELSGGEKQRVAIGRALVTNPKILLMDEPFSALDYNLRVYMQRLLKNLQKKLNITTIFVTHDREEAFFLSDKIGIMYEGSLIDFGTPQELYYNSKKLYTAKLLGVENILEGFKFEKIFKEKAIGKYIGVRGKSISFVEKSSIEGVIKNIEFKMGEFLFEVEVENEIIKIIDQNEKEYKLNEKIYIKYDNKNLIIIEE